MRVSRMGAATRADRHVILCVHFILHARKSYADTDGLDTFHRHTTTGVRAHIPHHTIPYHTIPYHTCHIISFQCIAFHFIALHCIALHCISFHFISFHTRPDQTRPDQTRPYHTIPYHSIHSSFHTHRRPTCTQFNSKDVCAFLSCYTLPCQVHQMSVLLPCWCCSAYCVSRAVGRSCSLLVRPISS